MRGRGLLLGARRAGLLQFNSIRFIAQTDCKYVRQEVCGEIVRVVLLEKCECQLHADEDAEAHAWSQTLAGERSVAALSSVAQSGGQGSVTGVLCCVDAMKELHAQAVVCCSCCWLATVLKCSSFHRRSALRGAPPTTFAGGVCRARSHAGSAFPATAPRYARLRALILTISQDGDEAARPPAPQRLARLRWPATEDDAGCRRSARMARPRSAHQRR